MPPLFTVSGTPLATAQPPFQSQQSFVRRLIEVTVKLDPRAGGGQARVFNASNSDTITLSGSRTIVRVQNSGAPGGSTASVSIYGLTPDLMNQLSTLGIVFNSVQRNIITVSAGDEVTGLSPIFTGTINFAYPDYNAAPDVPFHFECQSNTADATAPATATSFTGPTDVATIMASFARQLSLGFENNGVTVQLPTSYFPGNVWTQVQKVARDANIVAEKVDGDTKLAIWPVGGSRIGGPIPLISKDNGMDGYPTFQPNSYLVVKMLFNPQVAFGGKIQIESSIPQVNRTWVVYQLDLALDSLVYKGHWRATASCYPLGFLAPAPQQASQ